LCYYWVPKAYSVCELFFVAWYVIKIGAGMRGCKGIVCAMLVKYFDGLWLDYMFPGMKKCEKIVWSRGTIRDKRGRKRERMKKRKKKNVT
jgi:hypothetical protein